MQAFGQLPETMALAGAPSPLREPALRYAQALAAVEPAFLAKAWPDHQTIIERKRQELTQKFQPHDHQCLQYMIESLGMSDPHIEVTVYLFAEGPFPGASTSMTADGRGVCFVGVESTEGPLLYESILHEVTHALDIATRDQPTVFNRLRECLEEAGVDRRDRLWHDAWHVIMFIQAGETVRRRVDPQHVHYGASQSVYAKLKDIADVERPLWMAYLDHQITVDDAIDRIAAALLVKNANK
jgi:hypothetical protein